MDGDSCDETEASSEDLTSTSEAKDEYEESEYLSDHPSSSSPCFGTKRHPTAEKLYRRGAPRKRSSCESEGSRIDSEDLPNESLESKHPPFRSPFWRVEELLARRKSDMPSTEGQDQEEYLVKWENLAAIHSMWLPAEYLNASDVERFKDVPFLCGGDDSAGQDSGDDACAMPVASPSTSSTSDSESATDGASHSKRAKRNLGNNNIDTGGKQHSSWYKNLLSNIKKKSRGRRRFRDHRSRRSSTASSERSLRPVSAQSFILDPSCIVKRRTYKRSCAKSTGFTSVSSKRNRKGKPSRQSSMSTGTRRNQRTRASREMVSGLSSEQESGDHVTDLGSEIASFTSMSDVESSQKELGPVQAIHHPPQNDAEGPDNRIAVDDGCHPQRVIITSYGHH